MSIKILITSISIEISTTEEKFLLVNYVSFFVFLPYKNGFSPNFKKMSLDILTRHITIIIIASYRRVYPIYYAKVTLMRLMYVNKKLSKSFYRLLNGRHSQQVCLRRFLFNNEKHSGNYCKSYCTLRIFLAESV